MLRQMLGAVLRSIYRLTQSGSRHAADTHIERHVVEDFIASDYGALYGITREARAKLVRDIQAAVDNIPSATRMLYHVVLARELFGIPPYTRGDVVECGAHKGASSASLSLACALVNRKLWVCDSFAGLPSSEAEITRNYPHQKLYGHYEKGMFAGSLAEVRANIERYGQISRCEFVQGFFADTLGALPRELVFAFVDVDLTSSMRDCVRHLWPRLVEEGLFYTDDSSDMEVARIWFDDAWWQRELGQRPPGYVGTGCGLPLSVSGSSLGYVRKVADTARYFTKASWLDKSQ